MFNICYSVISTYNYIMTRETELVLVFCLSLPLSQEMDILLSTHHSEGQEIDILLSAHHSEGQEMDILLSAHHRERLD